MVDANILSHWHSEIFITLHPSDWECGDTKSFDADNGANKGQIYQNTKTGQVIFVKANDAQAWTEKAIADIGLHVGASVAPYLLVKKMGGIVAIASLVMHEEPKRFITAYGVNYAKQWVCCRSSMNKNAVLVALAKLYDNDISKHMIVDSQGCNPYQIDFENIAIPTMNIPFGEYYPFGIDEQILRCKAKECLLGIRLDDLLFYIDRLRPFSQENQTITKRLNQLAKIIIENYGILTDQDTSADLKRYFHIGEVHYRTKSGEFAT